MTSTLRARPAALTLTPSAEVRIADLMKPPAIPCSPRFSHGVPAPPRIRS